MNLSDWHEVLAAEAATPMQIGAIHGHFRRFGLDNNARRADRLAITAALLGRDPLASTSDLTMGEAGRLLEMLRGFADLAELRAAIAPRPSWQQDFIRRFAAAACRTLKS